MGQHQTSWGGSWLPWTASSSGISSVLRPFCFIIYFLNYFSQGAIDPVGERIYTLEQSEIAFRELAAGGHKVRLVLKHMLTSGCGQALSWQGDLVECVTSLKSVPQISRYFALNLEYALFWVYKILKLPQKVSLKFDSNFEERARWERNFGHSWQFDWQSIPASTIPVALSTYMMSIVFYEH